MGSRDRATSERSPRRAGSWLAVVALGLGVAVLLQPWVSSVRPTDGSQPSLAASAGAESFETRTEGARTAPPLRAEPAVRIDAADVEPPRPHPGVPVRLVVPALHVDAPVVPITAPDGVLLPPSDPRTLGWWRDGAQPGAATGSALITGHTVHTGGGAFDDLETLAPGDEVRVETGQGQVRYVVSMVRVYRKSTLARDAQRLFSQTVPGRLVLITCEDWNGSTYLSNAVVVALPR
jgi:LPXTG-site transpeptidase (sortase) family protein